MDQQQLKIHFHHGLGDCSNWARALLVWRKHGFRVKVSVEDNKQWLFDALDFEHFSPGDTGPHLEFLHPDCFGDPEKNELQGNKTFWNLGTPELPVIGSPEQIWEEISKIPVNIEPRIGKTAAMTADRFLSRLPEPIVLLHTHGTTATEWKSIPSNLCEQLYNSILDACGGSLILLDWDNRVPRMAHGHVRHTGDDWGHISLEELAALMKRASLFIGVDSGPLHFAALNPGLRVLGLWTRHLPWHLALRPNLNTIHLVPFRERNRHLRWDWHLIEWAQAERRAEAGPNPQEVADWARALLYPTQYLETPALARNVVFRQLIARIKSQTPISSRADRNATVSLALRQLGTKHNPHIVETGCIRSEDDWGAGYFGYILSCWLHHRNGGRLTSVDIDAEKLKVAERILLPFRKHVELVRDDSVKWLGANRNPIDLLYLDSLDTDVPLHAEHCLNEVKAAASSLAHDSLILIDDTPWSCGTWQGKGRLAVPYLIERGWQIVDSGFQVLLRSPTST